MDSKSPQTMKKEEISIHLSTPLLLPQSKPSPSDDLQFNRPPPADQDLLHKRRLEFGQFVAREAVLDEELWVRDLIFNLRTCKLLNFFVNNKWSLCVFDLEVDGGMAPS